VQDEQVAAEQAKDIRQAIARHSGLSRAQGRMFGSVAEVSPDAHQLLQQVMSSQPYPVWADTQVAWQ